MLAHAMMLMPNLHTIQIISIYERGYELTHEAFQTAFADLIFPSVRRAILAYQARSIFACLPEVLEAHMIGSHDVDFTEYLSQIAQNCHKIECFGWRQIGETNSVFSISMCITCAISSIFFL
jgi:hypothetical protein